MGMYRKKPVVIEARQFADDNAVDVAAWCHGTLSMPLCLFISTLEGVMTARPGDWIIKGVNGEFYPCKDGIFDKTYEAV